MIGVYLQNNFKNSNIRENAPFNISYDIYPKMSYYTGINSDLEKYFVYRVIIIILCFPLVYYVRNYVVFNHISKIRRCIQEFGNISIHVNNDFSQKRDNNSIFTYFKTF